MTRTRRLAATLAALAIILSGCTVPGQGGASGVAGEFDGHVVTAADVDAIYQAWLTETRGIDVANRRQILTVELMRPSALAKLEELGITMNLDAIGYEWLRHAQLLGRTQGSPYYQEIEDMPSETLRKGMEGAVAIAVLARHPEGAVYLSDLSLQIEAEGNISPRSGVFVAETFVESLYRAEENIHNRSLGNIFFVEFQHVNGLVDTERAWLTRE